MPRAAFTVVAALAMLFLIRAQVRPVRASGLGEVPPTPMMASVLLSASPKPVPVFEYVGGATSLSPGKITIKYASLKDFVVRAYHVPPYEIAGGPNWLESKLYEINAMDRVRPFRSG